MSLTPLNEDHVRRYLISRFSTPPVAALAPMIRRVSSGNPLLMVSMTDALVAAGSIVLGSDGWCLRYSPRTIERGIYVQSGAIGLAVPFGEVAPGRSTDAPIPALPLSAQEALRFPPASLGNAWVNRIDWMISRALRS
jgi:hypothetical protein